MEIRKEWGFRILRISLSLVFFWFAISQLLNPSRWVGVVPDFIVGMGIPAATIVTLNGIFELCLASLLILGLYTRFASIILSLHLIGIASTFGPLNPTGVRDYGLALATLSIFFFGKDSWCLDSRIGKERHNESEISGP